MKVETLNQTDRTGQWSKNARIIGQYSGIDSANWTLGLVESIDHPSSQQHIKELVKRTGSPNPFFTPPFFKAAEPSLASGKVLYLYLSSRIGNEETLKLFAPVMIQNMGLRRRKVIRAWVHEYAPLGTPLVCNRELDETVRAFTECILNAPAHHSTSENISTLVFELVSRENAFINKLYQSARISDRLLFANRVNRAGLKPLAGTDYLSSRLSGKRKQRLRKATRELEGLGTLSFRTVKSGNAVKSALQCFLELEAKGWKGKNKTALKSNANTESFCRQAVASMSDNGNCRIDSILLEGTVITSLITFENNGHFYPWKICYDEDFYKYSPGNLLATHATAQMAAEKNFKGLDSLAAEYNENTRHLWPDDKELRTMIIGLGDTPSRNTLELTDELNRISRVKNRLRKILRH